MYGDPWSSSWRRRAEPKTTISVKLTAAELKKLDSLRGKKFDWADELEPRGDVLRRLLELAPARKTSPRSRDRKTNAAGAR